MKTALVLFAAGLALATPGGHDLTITPISGEVRITPFLGGAPVAIVDASALRDQDVVRTDALAKAAISGATAWSATLESNSSAAVRSIAETEKTLTVFRRAFEVLAGSATWKATSDAVLLLPGAKVKANAVQVRVFYFGGVLNVEVTEGTATLEVTGETTVVTLTAGQRIQVQYNDGTRTFRFEIFEDNGEPIEILLGATILVVSKNDVLLARVDGTNLDLTVVRGLIQVTGPDGKLEDVGQGTILTVIGGSVGAVTNGNGRGGGNGRPLLRVVIRVPREPRRDPLEDRTNIRINLSPAGIR